MRNVLRGLCFSVCGVLMLGAAALAQPTMPGSGGGGGGGAPGGGGGGGGGSQYWGAVSFTASGSYSTTWRQPSKEVAEAKVATECAAFGRGACRTIGFPGELCVALVTYRGGRLRATFSGGGATYPDAQKRAMEQCENDPQTRRNRCTPLTAMCGDGR
jgi:hypothetical protein